MGDFGAYEIRIDVHVSHANTDLDLPAGRFEPASQEEADAARHLASVSFAGPDDEQSKPLATLVEPPAAQPAADQAAAVPEAQAPSAPADQSAGGQTQTQAPAAGSNEPPAGESSTPSQPGPAVPGADQAAGGAQASGSAPAGS